MKKTKQVKAWVVYTIRNGKIYDICLRKPEWVFDKWYKIIPVKIEVPLPSNTKRK